MIFISINIRFKLFKNSQNYMCQNVIPYLHDILEQTDIHNEVSSNISRDCVI